MVVYATTGLVFVGAGAVVTDPSLTFGTTLAMAGFWLAADGPPATRRAWGYAFFAGLAVGLLAKGPIAVVLTVLPIGAWVLWQRAVARPGYPPAVDRRHAARRGAGRAVVLGGRARDTRLSRLFPDRRALEALHRARLDRRPLRRGARVEARLDLAVLGRRRRCRGRSSRSTGWCASSPPRATACARGLPIRCSAYALCWALSPLVFFTASGNVLITYVLPGLPAFALVLGLFGPVASEARRTARPRGEARRSRRAASCAVALVAALVTQHARIDREFAQRALVRAYEAARADPRARLVYVGDEPVSAEFYTQGKAERVAHPAALAPYFADAHRDFFAVRDDDFAQFPAADRARMLPVATFGKFQLFAEAPPPAPASEPLPR